MERIDRPRHRENRPDKNDPKQATVPADPTRPAARPTPAPPHAHAILYEERDDTRRNETNKQRDEPTSETRARERERLEHHGYKQRPAEKIQ